MLSAYSGETDAFTSTLAERAAEPIEYWQSRIGDPTSLSKTFGAFHSEQLVGAVALECSAKSKTRHKGTIVGMYVSPASRGLGAGRALLDAAVAHARAQAQLKVLALTVTLGNDAAMHLYRAAGFVQFGLEHLAIFTGTSYKSKVHMQLVLSAPSNHAA